MTLFSGLGTDVHFSGDKTGLQWEDYLFELQNAVEWRMVMPRNQDERSQMHAMSLLLNTCGGTTNRMFIEDGARWILQGDKQERENRTAGVKALYSMLVWTTSGRAKELVKQGLSDWGGMIAFGRTRERFGKTADVAQLSDVFQFQWTSSDSLEDKLLRWLKLMRQVNMTSLGDDARETLTIAGLEKAKERSLEQHLRLRAPQTWIVQTWEITRGNIKVAERFPARRWDRDGHHVWRRHLEPQGLSRVGEKTVTLILRVNIAQCCSVMRVSEAKSVMLKQYFVPDRYSKHCSASRLVLRMLARGKRSLVGTGCRWLDVQVVLCLAMFTARCGWAACQESSVAAWKDWVPPQRRHSLTLRDKFELRTSIVSKLRPSFYATIKWR